MTDLLELVDALTKPTRTKVVQWFTTHDGTERHLADEIEAAGKRMIELSMSLRRGFDVDVTYERKPDATEEPRAGVAQMGIREATLQAAVLKWAAGRIVDKIETDPDPVFARGMGRAGRLLFKYAEEIMEAAGLGVVHDQG